VLALATFGEAAGENLYFMANAIAKTAPWAGLQLLLFVLRAARNQIGVSDTQNVIGCGIKRRTEAR
jgi:hypothetical protein